MTPLLIGGQMFKKKSDKDLREENRELKIENIRLKNELEAYKAREDKLNKLIVDSELLKREWEENIKEARIAKDNFENLYREIKSLSYKSKK